MNLGTIRRYYVEKWSDMLKKRTNKKEAEEKWTIGDVSNCPKNVQKGQTLKITQNHPKKTKAIDYKILLTYN